MDMHLWDMFVMILYKLEMKQFRLSIKDGEV